jgi:hypothetical protein
MDEHSKEELRVYSILQELNKKKYHENDLKTIFEFKKGTPLNATKLYKYIHLQKKDFPTRMFTILKGELVTGDQIQGRKPVRRGKYRITAVIDGVQFTYVERENNERKEKTDTVSECE